MTGHFGMPLRLSQASSAQPIPDPAPTPTSSPTGSGKTAILAQMLSASNPGRHRIAIAVGSQATASASRFQELAVSLLAEALSGEVTDPNHGIDIAVTSGKTFIYQAKIATGAAQPHGQPRLEDVRRYTGLERKLETHLAASVTSPLDGAAARFAQYLGRAERRCAGVLDALTTSAPPLARVREAITRLWRKMVDRLQSINGPTAPSPCQPPGQLVTAEPRVSRGPTSAWTAVVLSTFREPTPT
ncbi:hypothetical protein WEI85_06075 [Actinomycetes bacterium KLBMP 9797]